MCFTVQDVLIRRICTTIRLIKRWRTEEIRGEPIPQATGQSVRTPYSPAGVSHEYDTRLQSAKPLLDKRLAHNKTARYPLKKRA